MLFLWLILLIIFVVIEFVTMGLTTIWFAAGALLAALVAMLGGHIVLQTAVFLVVSIVLLCFTRPIAVKYFNKDRSKTNVESMIGRQAIVTGEINNLEGTGQVTVGGLEWSARSKDEGKIIPVGEVVIVRSISGVKLIVEPRVAE